MDKEQIKNNFFEFVFTSETKQDNLINLLILLVHSINKQQNLKCTGVLEDDIEQDYELPPNWNQPVSGIFSLRYKNNENKPIYFKFIQNLQQISINVVYNEQLHSMNILPSALDFKNIQNQQNNDFFKRYEENILLKLKDRKEKKEEQKSQQQADFFWNPSNRNTNNSQQPSQNPFGNYGRTDLEPVPLNSNIFQPFQPLSIHPNNSGGNLMGPNNPVFGNPQSMNNPNFRFDPVFPNNIHPEPDNDIFMGGFIGGPGNNRRGGGGLGRGGFGGGMGGLGGNNNFM